MKMKMGIWESLRQNEPKFPRTIVKMRMWIGGSLRRTQRESHRETWIPTFLITTTVSLIATVSRCRALRFGTQLFVCCCRSTLLPGLECWGRLVRFGIWWNTYHSEVISNQSDFAVEQYLQMSVWILLSERDGWSRVEPSYAQPLMPAFATDFKRVPFTSLLLENSMQ